MKTIIRVAALAMVFASATAFAGGEGCTEAKKAAKEGGACAKACGSSMAKAECAMGETVALGGAEDAGKAAPTGFGIGQKLPEGITLKNAVTGADEALVAADAKATVVLFWNQDCPYVVDADPRVAKFAEDMKGKGVRVVAVDSGINNKAETIKEYAAKRPFPVLLNPDSMLAADFGATRTPEVFVIDGKGVVQYHGAFDGGAKNPEKTYTADAVAAILEGKTPEVTQTKAFGCTIKWSKAAMERKEKMASAKAEGAEAKKNEAKKGNM
jgi:thiol-disulfide isomerase/thioredoxin